ncbi:PAS domain-containing sensor histidine kinase [Mucilaginibacter sp.]|uniref:PAS domain-containing sensor histidine kinase n=1 Tax=Mucilaginibacter sp. TaxID=1882438 RepID=UPI003D0E347D
MQFTNGENLKHAVRNAPIGICILDAKNLVAELVNDKFLQVAGKTYESIIGKYYWDAFEEVRNIYEYALNDVVQTGQPYYADEVELSLVRNNQEEVIFVTFVYAPIPDDKGSVNKIAVWVLENTSQVIDRKNKETAKNTIQKERDRLRKFIMQAPAGICVLNGSDLTFELINPLYQALFPGRQLLGKPLLDAVPEIKHQPIWNILQEVYQTGITFEGEALLIPLARNTGGPIEDRFFNFIYQARTDLNENVDGILVFVFEVTDIISGQRELRKTQDSLELAIEASGIGIWTANLITDELIITSRSREIHGIPRTKQLTLTTAFGLIFEEYRAKVTAGINKAVATKQDFCEEYWINPMDGGKPKWLKANGRAYYDESGKPLYITGAIFDLTEQKEDDLRKNDFIGMVSHELKTPLTSLAAMVQVSSAKLKNSEDSFLVSAMTNANNQVKKMTNLINGFLNVTRLESGKIQLDKKNFQMEDLVSDIIDESKLTSSSHVIKLFACKPILIFADADKIGSVISNLLSNAIKYSPKGTQIIVRCDRINDKMQVSVADEGLGIKEDDISHVFDRYYRVENPSQSHISGFGIGLYLSAEIIHQHGGEIWVESKIGKGSIFYFNLPIN